jgi:hypothetical protein
MSVESGRSVAIVETTDLDCDTSHSESYVEEPKLSLRDFLKTCVKIGGSDLHLQEASIPMIRVDGRAMFLDCAPPTSEAMNEYVDQILNSLGEPEDRGHMLSYRGMELSKNLLARPIASFFRAEVPASA